VPAAFTEPAPGGDPTFRAAVRKRVPTNDPDGVLKTPFPADKARYAPYPYEIRKVPWEAFEGKPRLSRGGAHDHPF
jgi:hypothetical protein